MKAIRLLVTLLLVTLCTGFYSCGKDYLDREPEESIDQGTEFNKTDKVFAEYIKDYSNILCRAYREGESSVILSGIKNNHLWFGEFDTTTKNIKMTWEDIKETDTIQQIHKGYGEYEKIHIKGVLCLYYKKTSTGNITSFNLNEYKQTIFISNGKSKRTQLGYSNFPYDWHKESVFIQDCCYSHEGDTIYLAKSSPKFENGKIATELISYEEGITFSGNYISKYNYKDAKSVWGVNITSPFDIPSDAKRNYTILNNSTNIWEYKVDVTFYDGTKKDFTFKINIDNGKIIADVIGVTLNEAEKELDLNETFQLLATISPTNATNKNITWSSSNENVAQINQNGLITAKSIGEAIITVTTEEGGFTASSKVTVNMKQEISAYIIADLKINGSNSMGQFWGVIDSKITNNSDKSITLTKAEIINGDRTIIFTKHYDSKVLNPRSSYEESVQGLPAISNPVSIKWTYLYNNQEYKLIKNYNK